MLSRPTPLARPFRILRLFAGSLLLTATSAVAATFYVAPHGNDSAPGTLDAPFATIQHAQTAVSPGDTVLIRGGLYKVPATQIAATRGIYACVTLLDKSGRPDAPIRYWAQPGEQPVFDFSDVKPPGQRVAAFRIEGDWIHLKGFEVIGVQVTIATHTQSICFDNQGSHNLYERLSAHDGMAIGFWIGAGAHNLVLNCDAYRNHDNVSGNKRGGNVDGFGYHGKAGSVNNVFRGCRAWFNSDDGFDLINSTEPTVIENCWAFYNGFSPDFTPLADGNGFKAGGHAGTAYDHLPQPIPRHAVIGSVAVRNKANGFYANHHIAGLDFLNNSALRNRFNFNLQGRDPADNKTLTSGRGHRLKNNLGLEAGETEVMWFDPAACDATQNAFTIPLTLTADDFLSLDESLLTQPRKPNGDLPDVPFLRLSATSRAIDRGIDIGRPFTGQSPDLGAFESPVPIP